MFNSLKTLSFVAVALLSAGSATASSCKLMTSEETTQAMKGLGIEYGEEMLFAGLANVPSDNMTYLLKVYVNEYTDTWTLVQLFANGQGCFLAVGESFIINRGD